MKQFCLERERDDDGLEERERDADRVEEKQKLEIWELVGF